METGVKQDERPHRLDLELKILQGMSRVRMEAELVVRVHAGRSGINKLQIHQFTS